MALQPYQSRVVEEYNELVDKLNGLNKYLETHSDTNLEIQQVVMTQYATILNTRIELFYA